MLYIYVYIYVIISAFILLAQYILVIYK